MPDTFVHNILDLPLDVCALAGTRAGAAALHLTPARPRAAAVTCSDTWHYLPVWMASVHFLQPGDCMTTYRLTLRHFLQRQLQQVVRV